MHTTFKHKTPEFIEKKLFKEEKDDPRLGTNLAVRSRNTLFCESYVMEQLFKSGHWYVLVLGERLYMFSFASLNAAKFS